MRVAIGDVEVEWQQDRGGRVGMLWCHKGKVSFPGLRTMARLSRLYLNKKMKEIGTRIDGHSTYIEIEPGLNREQKAAFLGAFIACCKAKQQ